MYEYNFEMEFPYTPNVRGVRTDEWSDMHYPNGDGSPDAERAELYNIHADPQQKNNLIVAAEAQTKLTELRTNSRESSVRPAHCPTTCRSSHRFDSRCPMQPSGEPDVR
jgi:N-acetylglucosamine-6-sulfatase